MLMKNQFGIDLGTSSVKIYSTKKDQITKEKNMIAIKDKNEVLAVGNDAYEMYEKAPDNIEVHSPMSYGMIADIDQAEMVLHTLLHRADKYIGQHPVLYFSVPTDMTEIEKRAYYAIAQGPSLRKSKVYIIERPIADALAMGIDLKTQTGSMVVNIGAESMELSIIINGKVIISKIVHIGGRELTDSLCDLVRRKKNLLIGIRTSERLKISLTNIAEKKKEARKIIGVNTLSGLPRESIISSALVTEAIEDKMKAVAEEIKIFLERTPPQIAKVILQDGIYLSGGSTQIPGLSTFLSEYIGCPVRISQYYDLCTIQGITMVIKNKELEQWAVSIKEKARY